jgi:hypothetical protein
MKRDRELVMEAVKQNVFALKYASEELKGDRAFVEELIQVNPDVLYYASQELQNDPEFEHLSILLRQLQL